MTSFLKVDGAPSPVGTDVTRIRVSVKASNVRLLSSKVIALSERIALGWREFSRAKSDVCESFRS